MILVGVAIAGAIQVTSAPEAVGVPELANEPEAPAPLDEDQPNAAVPTTTLESPFVYRLGVLAGITTDNFWAYYGEQASVWNAYILGPTKPALFTIEPETARLVPELALVEATPVETASGWEITVDLTDMKWSDGAPITAEDFVFTFETVRGLDLAGSWSDAYPAQIETMEAVSETRLRIGFSDRPTLSVWPYGVGLAPVMPAHLWRSQVEGLTAKELYALEGSHDAGGGPLTLTAHSQSLIVNSRNDGYAKAGVPDRVQYHVFPDEGTATMAVADGEIDAVLSPQGVSPNLRERVASTPGVAQVTSNTNSIRYLGFNLEREPMNSLAFRQALATILDRTALASEVEGTGDAAFTLISPSAGAWYSADDAAKVSALYQRAANKDRLDAALTLLEADGYTWTVKPTVAPDGEFVAGEGLAINGRAPQPVTILAAGDLYEPARPEYVQRIADHLAVLGFDARPVITDFETVVDLTFSRSEGDDLHYDMYVLGWTLGNPALPAFYSPLFSSEGELNNTGYASDRFDAAVARYENAHDQSEARESLWEMELILANDLPYLPLYTAPITEIFRSDRVTYSVGSSLGGLQARLGGIADVSQVD